MAKQQSLWQMEPEELTDLVDPSLKFIKSYILCSTNVFRVETPEREQAILKVGIQMGDSHKMDDLQSEAYEKKWAFIHIERERRVLEYLAGIPGIPKLYNTYQNMKGPLEMNYTAILKEFIEGYPADQLEKPERFQKNMEQLIRTLCKKGVYLKHGPLELTGKNILITDNEQPYIIDLGCTRIIPSDRKDTRSHKTILYYHYFQFKKKYFPDIK